MIKNELIEQVLDREWQMFVRVRSANPAPCQSAPANFRTIRGSLFEMWSEAMLQAYPRATEDSPYGGAIAQGYLTLCFLARFSREVIARNNDRICINYGLDRVRFPAPVRAGQRARAHLSLASIHKLNGGGRIAWHGSVEIENGEKPACYAELISQWFNTSAKG